MIPETPTSPLKRPRLNLRKVDLFNPDLMEYFRSTLNIPDEHDIFHEYKVAAYFLLKSDDELVIKVTPEAKKALDKLYKSKTEIPGLGPMTERHYNSCLIMLSMMTHFALKTKKPMVKICFQTFRKIHVDYVKLVDFLKSNHLFETIPYTFSQYAHQLHRNKVTEYSVVGIKDCLNNPLEANHYVKSPKLVHLVTKVNQKMLDYKERNHGNKNSFHFDARSMKNINAFVQDFVDKKKKEIRTKSRKRKSPTHPKQQFKELFTYLYTLSQNLYQIQVGLTKTFTDEYGFRVHSNFTTLPKEIRRELKVKFPEEGNGVNDTVELDIGSSQVAITALILEERFPIYNGLLAETDPQSYRNLKTKFDAEMKDFRFLLENGQFYQTVADHLLEHGKLKIPAKEAKTMTFAFLFGPYNKGTKYSITSGNPEKGRIFLQFFQRNFPTIVNMIRQMKIKENANFAKILQRVESKLMKRLGSYLDDQKIPKILIHDSIIVPFTKMNTVKAFFTYLIKTVKLPTVISSTQGSHGRYLSGLQFLGLTKSNLKHNIIKDIVKGKVDYDKIWSEESTPGRLASLVDLLPLNSPGRQFLLKKIFSENSKAKTKGKDKTKRKPRKRGTFSSPVFGFMKSRDVFSGFSRWVRGNFLYFLESDEDYLTLFMGQPVSERVLKRFGVKTEDEIYQVMLSLL